MILLAIEDVTQRARLDLARLASAQEEERRRVAREIHDDLIQRLASLAIDLGGCASKLPTSPQRLKKQLRSFQTRVVGAADTGRRVAYELHPSELEDAGLEEVLRAHCESISQSHGFAVTFSSRNLPQGLSRELASCLYRVAQESLRNVAKHATARKANVTLEGTAARDSPSCGGYGRRLPHTVSYCQRRPGCCGHERTGAVSQREILDHVRAGHGHAGLRGGPSVGNPG